MTIDYTRDEVIECLCDWAEQFKQTIIDVFEYRRRLRTLGMNASEIDDEIKRTSK